MILNQNTLRRPNGKLWFLRQMHNQAWIDIGKGVQDSTLIAGVGRSGTTWLSEVIAASTKSREIFEPFVLDEASNFALSTAGRVDGKLGYRPNISLSIPFDIGAVSSSYDKVKRILEGRIRCWWSEQHTQPGIYKRRVIKDIRANLMLGWLSNSWPDLKIIYVIRNPLSTVASMLERSSQGWEFDWDATFVLNDDYLMEDCLAKFRSVLEEKHDQDARLMLRWCVENYVALKQVSGNKNVKIVRYDDLIKNPILWEGVFDFIGWQYDKGRFLAQINQKSRTASTYKGAAAKVFKIEKERANSLIRIVEIFGLQEYL